MTTAKEIMALVDKYGLPTQSQIDRARAYSRLQQFADNYELQQEGMALLDKRHDETSKKIDEVLAKIKKWENGSN